jgi:hypothetical protein
VIAVVIVVVFIDKIAPDLLDRLRNLERLWALF